MAEAEHSARESISPVPLTAYLPLVLLPLVLLFQSCIILQLPRLASMIAGLSNFRDVGGLPTRAGTVRRNRLFRSAQPGQITPGGTESLRQLGITTMFDLRSTVEISNYDFMRVKDIDGIQRVSVPIFTNSDTSQQILKRRNYALGQPVTIPFSFFASLSIHQSQPY